MLRNIIRALIKRINGTCINGIRYLYRGVTLLIASIIVTNSGSRCIRRGIFIYHFTLYYTFSSYHSDYLHSFKKEEYNHILHNKESI